MGQKDIDENQGQADQGGRSSSEERDEGINYQNQELYNERRPQELGGQKMKIMYSSSSSEEDSNQSHDIQRVERQYHVSPFFIIAP